MKQGDDDGEATALESGGGKSDDDEGELQPPQKG